MTNEGLMFMKVRRTLVKSWLSPLLVYEHDKVASQKGFVLHSKAAMKRFGMEKKRLQYNTVDLFAGIRTDLDR